MERIILVGSEDVISGGRIMANAAQDMKSAASQIENALFVHQQFLQQWLCDFQQTIEGAKDANLARIDTLVARINEQTEKIGRMK
jgi:hypothetical protein